MFICLIELLIQEEVKRRATLEAQRLLEEMRRQEDGEIDHNICTFFFISAQNSVIITFPAFFTLFK